MRRQTLTTLLGKTGAVLLAAAGLVADANAHDLIGVWLTKDGQAQVRIARCAEDFCGTIIALKDPIDPATGKPQADTENEDTTKRNRPVMGLQVLTGMKPGGADKWSGRLYSPEDGKTVGGDLTLKDANTLIVQGCLLGGLLCRAETWTRAK
jgi:uncharacterized protein (DUF2147 family)